MLIFELLAFTMAIPLPGYSIQWGNIKQIETNKPFYIDFEMKFPDRVLRNKTHPLIIFNPGPPRPDQIEVSVSLLSITERRVAFHQLLAKNSKYDSAEYYLPSYIKGDEFQFKATLRNVDSLASLIGPQVTSYSPKFKLVKSKDPEIKDELFLELGDDEKETVSIQRRQGKLYAQSFNDGVISTRLLDQ